MMTPTWKRWFILFCGLLENLVFSGSILGWSALNYMLKQEGIFADQCVKPPTPGGVSSALPPLVLRNGRYESPAIEYKHTRLAHYNYTLSVSRDRYGQAIPLSAAFDNEPILIAQNDHAKVTGCAAQDRLLNLAYTMGSFFNGFTAFIWGFLLDRWGLRAVRLVIKIANMQFANLFPKNRSTVITFYSGAFSASAIIFVILKYVYDAGISFSATCATLVVLSVAMVPFTLFVLPVHQVKEDTLPDSFEDLIIVNRKYQRKAQKALSHVRPTVTLEKFQVIGSPRLDRKSSTGSQDVPTISVIAHRTGKQDGGKDAESVRASSSASSELEIPLRHSLLSLPFTLHQWWYSWLITYMIMYVGTMNLWLQRVTTDIQVASNFSKVFGIVQVLALVLAPMAGFLMDYQVNRANQEQDLFKRQLNRVRAGFWPMMFTTGTIAAAILCRFFDTTTSIYVSIAFITLLRSFLIAVASAYLRIRFPASHFNRLLGIMSTCGSFVTLLQFPLFVWEAEDDANALWVSSVKSTLIKS
ncbi:Solute carrier family 43 member 3 [Halotydeus destructor]|nr:Solute carrier family 43 member 3 [Halotydeus destructor]